MIELTGENLSAYLLREIRNIVNRNPRFRNLGGDVTVATSSMVAWGDLRVTINRVSAQGTRMSPDYFLCTQYGRTVLGKLENYDGLFIEWVQEIQENWNTIPPSGVYYLNVDSVDEGTRNVQLTIQKYQWVGESPRYANGSLVYFASHIDVSSVTPVDPAIQYAQQGNTLAILSFSPNMLELQTPHGLLTPMVDFWYMREVKAEIIPSTAFGEQLIMLPIPDYYSVAIFDQDGYPLKEGVDFFFNAPNIITTGSWTPEGSTLIGTFVIRVDPSSTLAAHPENQVSATLAAGDAPVPDQTILYSSLLNRSSSSDFLTIDGVTWLTTLLVTGERYYWESRIDLGQDQYSAKKMEVNKNLIDGLSIAIGDQVFVNDQCAILISPKPSEIYEIYGSKENVSFTIEVKANDRMTASEVAEMIKGSLLVRERTNMEANGLTIFEISRESVYESRDSSGTAPTTTHTLNVSAAADWELHIPLITRISQFNVDMQDTPQTDFIGKISLPPRISTLGVSQFLPNYS